MNTLAHYHIEDDVLMVHKPKGISSFGLVARMKKVLNTKKVGHAGTLDPLASGLMIIGYNKGTKKLASYLGMDKVYLAEIFLGRSTTTGDQEGDIVDEDVPYASDVSKQRCEEALESLLGEHFFPAPLYSAVKVQGKPLYRYARDGTTPPFIPEKKLHLKHYQLLDLYKTKGGFVVKVRASVGSGSYIRTLAEEFGKKLGCPASLKSLARVSIGDFLDRDAFFLDKPKKDFCAILKVYSLIKKRVCRFFFKQKK